MITLQTRTKKIIFVVFAIINIALPLSIIILGAPSEYEQILKWLPINPIYTVVTRGLGYLLFLFWFIYLYKTRRKIGDLKTVGISLALFFTFVFYALLTAFIELFFLH
jgi:hypothetical protein